MGRTQRKPHGDRTRCNSCARRRTPLNRSVPPRQNWSLGAPDRAARWLADPGGLGLPPHANGEAGVAAAAASSPANMTSPPTAQPTPRPNPLVVARETILTSTVHFSGASFAIASHLGKHGFPVVTELEFVGFVAMSLSATLSGLTLAAALKLAALATFTRGST
jgi:hypothetical protein